MGKTNVRQGAAKARKRAAQRYAASNAPCALCHGARGPIRYDQPRDHRHPLSLVIDEIAPVARWEEFGYPSARACACDPSNWQPAHYICNAIASDKRGARAQAVKRIEKADRPSGTF